MPEEANRRTRADKRSSVPGYGQDLVIRTKLVLPRPRRYLLRRPALTARLLEAQHYRLTVVQASTGYGKSTALASALQEAPLNLFWYSITASDRDPVLFLLHLIYAFRLRWPEFGGPALKIIKEAGTAPYSHQSVVNALSNELVSLGRQKTVLVLDDYHLVNPAVQVNAIVDGLLQVLPPDVHLIIAARQRPALETLTRWRVKGEVLAIGQQDLAFSAGEIEALFRTQYDLPLNARQVQRLAAETEGWIIALQMIWQGLQSGVAGSLDQILEEIPRSLEDLFTYLAQEVLARQPAHVQDFLLRTSVLRQLDPAACDYLLDWQEGSASLLSKLDQEGFFLVRLDEAYRYHHLFHDFLRQQAARDMAGAPALHRRAATFYQPGDVEEAIYHWLAAAEHETAAEMMVQASEALVRDGRLDPMSEWVAALSPPVLERFPALMYRLGELCRFASRFDEALAWYEQAQERYSLQRDVAGASRALRGQAAVYLDTVRPIKAESLLQEALRLVDGQPNREERARLLELMAENMTNRGKWAEAETLRRQARELRQEGPGPADLDVRVLLRTGRLDEARLVLEERAAQEHRSPARFREPRAHRETRLVLSLIYAWQGRPEQAFVCARQGIEIGRRLGSPFIEAVGYMRLGHAWQIRDHPQAVDQALACYQRAMDIGERLAAPRTKAEAMWGLCRLYGFRGDLAAAERSAREGIEVGLGAGDEWIAALTGVTLGAGYVIAGRDEDAARWLQRSAEAFYDCGDPFGQTVTRLWQCLLYHWRGATQWLPALEEMLAVVEARGYEFLFGRLTFLGPPDPSASTPLLIAARQGQTAAVYAAHLLEGLGLPPDLTFHPGYTLRIQTLGRFVVHRGRETVGDDEWRREKARQLFLLLLAERGRFLQRDEIAARLWPEADSATAEGQFKVTLNALQHVLEPARPPRAPTLFVRRRGSAYGLDPTAPIWIDAVAFQRLVAQGDAAQDEASTLDCYCQALALYRGDFLPDCLYEDWCRDERERLRRLYLTAAAKAAEILLARGDLDEAIRLGQRLLAVDDCCEPAYQLLIRAYGEQGDRVQALRTYERCLARLRRELDVAPAPETTALYEAIRASAEQ
jgi:LuxR family maltose regulon positive regulatory protein